VQESEEFAVLLERFQRQAIAPAYFYPRLLALARQSSADLSAVPSLTGFAAYLEASRSLQSHRLMPELEQVERVVAERLAGSEEARMLLAFSHHAKLLHDLFALKLTPDQVADYQAHRDEFATKVFTAFLEKVSASSGVPSELRESRDGVEKDLLARAIDAHLPLAERFYELAHQRDRALAERTLRFLEEREASPVKREAQDLDTTGATRTTLQGVANDASRTTNNARSQAVLLVAGGFHTPGITALLRKRQVSYVVITPTAAGELDEELYHRLVRGETATLTELIDTARAQQPLLQRSAPIPFHYATKPRTSRNLYLGFAAAVIVFAAVLLMIGIQDGKTAELMAQVPQAAAGDPALMDSLQHTTDAIGRFTATTADATKATHDLSVLQAAMDPLFTRPLDNFLVLSDQLLIDGDSVVPSVTVAPVGETMSAVGQAAEPLLGMGAGSLRDWLHSGRWMRPSPRSLQDFSPSEVRSYGLAWLLDRFGQPDQPVDITAMWHYLKARQNNLEDWEYEIIETVMLGTVINDATVSFLNSLQDMRYRLMIEQEQKRSKTSLEQQLIQRIGRLIQPSKRERELQVALEVCRKTVSEAHINARVPNARVKLPFRVLQNLQKEQRSLNQQRLIRLTDQRLRLYIGTIVEDVVATQVLVKRVEDVSGITERIVQAFQTHGLKLRRLTASRPGIHTYGRGITVDTQTGRVTVDSIANLVGYQAIHLHFRPCRAFPFGLEVKIMTHQWHCLDVAQRSAYRLFSALQGIMIRKGFPLSAWRQLRGFSQLNIDIPMDAAVFNEQGGSIFVERRAKILKGFQIIPQGYHYIITKEGLVLKRLGVFSYSVESPLLIISDIQDRRIGELAALTQKRFGASLQVVPAGHSEGQATSYELAVYDVLRTDLQSAVHDNYLVLPVQVTPDSPFVKAGLFLVDTVEHFVVSGQQASGQRAIRVELPNGKTVPFADVLGHYLYSKARILQRGPWYYDQGHPPSYLSPEDVAKREAEQDLIVVSAERLRGEVFLAELMGEISERLVAEVYALSDFDEARESLEEYVESDSYAEQLLHELDAGFTVERAARAEAYRLAQNLMANLREYADRINVDEASELLREPSPANVQRVERMLNYQAGTLPTFQQSEQNQIPPLREYLAEKWSVSPEWIAELLQLGPDDPERIPTPVPPDYTHVLVRATENIPGFPSWALWESSPPNPFRGSRSSGKADRKRSPFARLKTLYDHRGLGLLTTQQLMALSAHEEKPAGYSDTTVLEEMRLLEVGAGLGLVQRHTDGRAHTFELIDAVKDLSEEQFQRFRQRLWDELPVINGIPALHRSMIPDEWMPIVRQRVQAILAEFVSEEVLVVEAELQEASGFAGISQSGTAKFSPPSSVDQRAWEQESVETGGRIGGMKVAEPGVGANDLFRGAEHLEPVTWVVPSRALAVQNFDWQQWQKIDVVFYVRQDPTGRQADEATLDALQVVNPGFMFEKTGQADLRTRIQDREHPLVVLGDPAAYGGELGDFDGFVQLVLDANRKLSLEATLNGTKIDVKTLHEIQLKLSRA